MSEGHYRYSSQPAAEIIRRCGVLRAVAEYLKVSPEAVSKCGKPKTKGGTGGTMPVRWHRPLALLCEQNGLKRQYVMDSLTSASQKKITGEEFLNAAKEKGDRFEREVVDDLRAAGFRAHRVPLSGAHAEDKGDVIVETE